MYRFKKFIESSYGVPSDIEYWETRDSHGSMVLIQGTKTGASKVKARIKNAIYSNVNSAETILIVIANLILIPSYDIYLIPLGTIKYNVELIKSGESKELTMPSDQYYLEVTNSKVALLNPETSVVTGLIEGKSELILKDRNIKVGDGVRQPTAEIFVREPSYMTISVRPGENWALQEETVYIITLQIFDDYHHKIHSSGNIDLQVAFPSKHFTSIFSTHNGTYHVVQTLVSGVCRIKAQLIGSKKEDGTVVKLSLPLDLEQEVKIYPKLKVTPSSIFFPWDPVAKPTYSLYPYATGGTGFYHWESLDTSIATISFRRDSKESSKAVVHTLKNGNISLIVTDNLNSVFRDVVHVSIQPIADIEIVLTVFETQLGSSVYVPLSLFGFEDIEKTKKRPFDDCSKIPIIVEVVEKTRFVYIDDPKISTSAPVFNQACCTLQFDCKSIGHSRIFVKYQSGDGSISLQTSAVIACYLPLKLIHPVPMGVLALGTSVELTFEGGPRAWSMATSNHFTRLTPEKPKLFETMTITDPYRFKKNLHIFRVSCKEIGESSISLSVGNLASATLPNPVQESVEANLVCANPSTFYLRPKLKSDENCPLINLPIGESFNKIPISNALDSYIEIHATDKKGRKFLNITSLFLTWQLSDYNLAKLASHKYFVEEVNEASGYRKWNRNYQLLYPLRKEGDLLIEVVATNYRKDVLMREGITIYNDLVSEIKATALVSLINKPTIKPEEISIFNHPKNKVSIIRH